MAGAATTITQRPRAALAPPNLPTGPWRSPARAVRLFGSLSVCGPPGTVTWTVIHVAATIGLWRWGSGMGSGQLGGAEEEGGGLPYDPGGQGLRGGGSSPGSTSLGGEEALIPAIWPLSAWRGVHTPPTGSNGRAQQEGERDRWPWP